jgi:DNA-binding transcriptional MocR family regulator
LRCGREQIIIVNGSQQGLDLCARMLLDAGDRFVIETPCYWAARHVFESVGATPQFVPVDAEGLRTDALESIKKARLCYVTPSHQFPLGHVLSASRRAQLLRWAGDAGAYIVEDDYDGEYRYDIRPIQPLHAFDEAARVIYLGTISKTLSPLLRLGYLVLPPELVDAFRAAKRLTDRHSPTLEQALWQNSSNRAPMSGMSESYGGKTRSAGSHCSMHSATILAARSRSKVQRLGSMWSRGSANSVRRRKGNWREKLGRQASASTLFRTYTNVG